MAGPTSKPFAKAFACAGIAFVVVVVAALVLLGPPGAAAARLAGGLFAAVAITALVTGFLARRSAKAWSLGRFIATYLLALVIILVLYWIGAKGR